MTGWHIAHLLALGAWAGLVMTEAVIEIAGHRSASLAYAVARFHRSIDLFVELPLLGAVLLTGSVLFHRATPNTALWIKVVFAHGAIAANLACVYLVLRRARLAEGGPDQADSGALRRLTRLIFGAFIVGIPLALVALVLGGSRLGWW